MDLTHHFCVLDFWDFITFVFITVLPLINYGYLRILITRGKFVSKLFNCLNFTKDKRYPHVYYFNFVLFTFLGGSLFVITGTLGSIVFLPFMGACLCPETTSKVIDFFRSKNIPKVDASTQCEILKVNFSVTFPSNPLSVTDSPRSQVAGIVHTVQPTPVAISTSIPSTSLGLTKVKIETICEKSYIKHIVDSPCTPDSLNNIVIGNKPVSLDSLYLQDRKLSALPSTKKRSSLTANGSVKSFALGEDV
jgi:hypothetical protein